jgi:hypothetical protein
MLGRFIGTVLRRAIVAVGHVVVVHGAREHRGWIHLRRGFAQRGVAQLLMDFRVTLALVGSRKPPAARIT